MCNPHPLALKDPQGPGPYSPAGRARPAFLSKAVVTNGSGVRKQLSPVDFKQQSMHCICQWPVCVQPVSDPQPRPHPVRQLGCTGYPLWLPQVRVPGELVGSLLGNAGLGEVSECLVASAVP